MREEKQGWSSTNLAEANSDCNSFLKSVWTCLRFVCTSPSPRPEYMIFVSSNAERESEANNYKEEITTHHQDNSVLGP